MTALGVLCCFALFVCLFDLACFFLSSFSSLIKNMYSQRGSCVMNSCSGTAYDNDDRQIVLLYNNGDDDDSV